MQFIPMPVFSLIGIILEFYQLVIFAMVILSWLIGFNVINRHNQFVDMIWRMVNSLTEPVLRPIRRYIPSIGGMDLSPLILLFGVIFLQMMNKWIAIRIGIV